MEGNSNTHQRWSWIDTYSSCWFAWNGYLRIIKYFHEHGADIHAQDLHGQTGLYKAAQGGNFPIVQYLVDNGVNVNVRDNYGWSALRSAKRRAGKPEYDAIIAYLLAVLHNQNKKNSFLFILVVFIWHVLLSWQFLA